MSTEPTPPTAPTAPDYDAAALAESLASAAEKSAKLIGEFAKRQSASGKSIVADELGIGKAFLELAAQMMGNPMRLAESQMNLWWDYMSLWQSSLMKMMGAPLQAPPSPDGDKQPPRHDWEEHFLFDYIKQSYLITARWLHEQVASVEGLDNNARKKVDFLTRRYIDALAPSNLALTNPEVFQETVATRGQNLVKGLHNLLDDIERGNGQLKISMTDAKAFELGVNIATTPGKVIFRNELMELLQYTPTTAKVGKRPLLIVSPWINKFYILDLREKNSFIHWAVGEGNTVFVISWVNPNVKLANKSFEDYVLEGPLAALDAIELATGENKVNALGYCLGGTLLAATLGYMAAKDDKRITSATFMASLVDFAAAGELELFVDEDLVATLETKVNERAFLESSELASTFNMLRANDMIWSFVMNNYLMGRDPFPFDLLHWNNDTTRMPARMHSFYLRNMYLGNKLAQPGGISLRGEAIHLAKVAIPNYFVAAIEDHIAPWKASYKGTRVLRGKSRFVLAGSGHVAGMINPPVAARHGYWTNEATPAQPDKWLDTATHHDGSWWQDWAQWLPRGRELPARIPGKGKLTVLGDAPGTYVRVRAEGR